jgi:beta-lactam-binding protein with PASTA domain
MQRRLILWLVVLAALLVASGLGLAFAAVRDEAPVRSDNAPGLIEVPHLVGMQYRPMQELLARVGLRWGYTGTKHVWSKPPPSNMSSTSDDDYVIDQSPEAGTKVAPGSVIRVGTSCGVAISPTSACID